MIVDTYYYDNDYLGEPVPAAVFERYAKRAEEAVAAVTYNRVTEDNIERYPEYVQTAYKSAVCAQIEYYAYNGISSANDGASDSDYTLGRISVSKPNISAQEKRQGNRRVCASAVSLLELTGLMNPNVSVFGGM